MKVKNLLAALLAASLGACVSNTRMPLDADVSYAPWHSAESIESFRNPVSQPLSMEKAEFCVAQTITNRSVSVKDSTGSFIGPYTGRYYDNEKAREIGGGDVLLHSSEDAVVAQGIAKYQASTFVERVVRYTVTISDAGFEFSNLEQAQLNSGVVANDGFHPIGAWKAANPDLAIKSMSDVANKLHRCMR